MSQRLKKRQLKKLLLQKPLDDLRRIKDYFLTREEIVDNILEQSEEQVVKNVFLITGERYSISDRLPTIPIIEDEKEWIDPAVRKTFNKALEACIHKKDQKLCVNRTVNDTQEKVKEIRKRVKFG